MIAIKWSFKSSVDPKHIFVINRFTIENNIYLYRCKWEKPSYNKLHFFVTVMIVIYTYILEYNLLISDYIIEYFFPSKIHTK